MGGLALVPIFDDGRGESHVQCVPVDDMRFRRLDQSASVFLVVVGQKGVHGIFARLVEYVSGKKAKEHALDCAVSRQFTI